MVTVYLQLAAACSTDGGFHSRSSAGSLSISTLSSLPSSIQRQSSWSYLQLVLALEVFKLSLKMKSEVHGLQPGLQVLVLPVFSCRHFSCSQPVISYSLF
jgi:hypothetical protein